MLGIIRTVPANLMNDKFMNTSIVLRDGEEIIPGRPDIVFPIKTYQKIAETGVSNAGDQILLSVNLFLKSLNLTEQIKLYDMYKFTKTTMSKMTEENRRAIENDLQKEIFDTFKALSIPQRLIAFCQTDHFVYPDLTTEGTKAHHTPEKTYVSYDYVETTAISLLNKLMVPIWGEFIAYLKNMEVDANKVEKIAFDLIEPTLEDTVFERIYKKLRNSLSILVKNRRRSNDAKATMSGVSSSYVLTHNGIDDEMFNDIVMATIIVKRLATYDCFTVNKDEDNRPPNIIVYIDDSINRTTETKLQSMRKPMTTMPRKPLPAHDTEDNQSIIDHASKISSKPIDVPVTVVTAVKTWELPRLIEITQTPIDVFESASVYYQSNSFDISPLCQAMTASFIGTRFGGPKCLSYLPPVLYQQVVILLQVYLIRNGYFDLARLVTANSSELPLEQSLGSLPSRMETRLRTNDYYNQCLVLFKGWVEKPIVPLTKRANVRKIDTEKLDFTTHINKMREWIISNIHRENMAPSLWSLSDATNIPPPGAPVEFDENVIVNLCRFYLAFHSTQRPF